MPRAHQARTPQRGPRICIGIWFIFQEDCPGQTGAPGDIKTVSSSALPGGRRGREPDSALKGSTPHLGTPTPPASGPRSLKIIGSRSFDFFFPLLISRPIFSDLSFFLLWLERGGKRERKKETQIASFTGFPEISVWLGFPVVWFDVPYTGKRVKPTLLAFRQQPQQEGPACFRGFHTVLPANLGRSGPVLPPQILKALISERSPPM